MLRLTLKKWVILFCLISPTAFSFSEEIYHWTDDKGSVHFTDDVSTIPAPYQNQVRKRDMTRGISNEPLEQTVSRPASAMPAQKTKQPAKQEGSPGRVMGTLNTRDKKREEQKAIEQRISTLDGEMKATEELIKNIEKEEQDNHPSVQRHLSKYGTLPAKTPHYREKMKLADEVKAIQEEIATLKRRLSEINRGL
jgi:TolA-binding protein